MSRYIDLDQIEFLKADGNKEFNHGVDCCINRLLKAEPIKPIKDIKEYYKEIWDCEVNHPKYEDTVKDIVKTSYTTGYIQGVERTEKEYKIEIKNSISLDKVKQVRKEVAKYQSIHDSYCEHIEKGDCWEGHTPNHYESSGGKATACDYLLQILDKLIAESEE